MVAANAPNDKKAGLIVGSCRRFIQQSVWASTKSIPYFALLAELFAGPARNDTESG